MLIHLYIENFTIIEKLDLPFHGGMTAITGETGAGKSIILDALDLVLGARADNSFVRAGSERCDISATFDIQQNPAAQTWLNEHDLAAETECIVRRTISQDNRSKYCINAKPVTSLLLRELGTLLVNIHGQHEHQQLMQRDTQRELLDSFAGHLTLSQTVAGLYQQWRELTDAMQQQQQLLGDRDSRLAFLQYQVQEFTQLNCTAEEIKQLDIDHKNLATVEQRITKYQQLLQLLDNEFVQQAYAVALTLPEKNIAELLESASIQLKEALAEVQHHLDKAEINPERLQQVEQRLSKIHDMARKHKIKIEELPVLQEKLSQELKSLQQVGDQLESLQAELNKASAQYIKAAKELSVSRHAAAKKMAKQIEQHMHTLGMPGGRFDISFEPYPAESFNVHGLEKIVFMVSANPGQPLQALTKVASGGELSRISLAIQVIAAEKQQLPTLIFDEVDVGIGGSTAAIVGGLLKQLAERAQIICVTHLPQVAAQGQQHLQVHKTVNKKQTSTSLNYLTGEEKVREIARMLGGVTITKQTLAHAKEMVEVNQ